MEAATTAFRDRLAALTEQYGVPAAEPRAVGERAADLSAAGLVWAEEIGPLVDTDAVRRLLGGVTRQAVDERVRSGRLLALRTADAGGAARRVYPLWQFEGETSEHLPTVLAAVGHDPDDLVHGWWVTAWLCAADPDLAGLSPRELLAAGRPHPVLVAAADVREELSIDELVAADAVEGGASVA